MARYIFKRILMMIPVLLGVIIIVFFLNHFMPGDPVVNMLGNTYTQEEYDEQKESMGLNAPVLVQLFNYIKGVVTKFDLGTSYMTGRTVADELRGRLGTTLKIGVLSCLVTILLGVPLGVLSATRQYSLLDYTVTVISIFFAAMPGFWLALMSIIVFVLKLNWLPASGLATWKHYILPVMCNGLAPLAVTMRMTRSSMLEVINQDYMRTARAKGLGEGAIIRRHALKNALIPIITVTGTQFSVIVGGSVIIESIFSIPGIGMLMVSSISTRDYPMVLGITFILSIFVCVINIIVDLVYSIVDPRIKAQFSAESAKHGKRGKRKFQEAGG